MQDGAALRIFLALLLYFQYGVLGFTAPSMIQASRQPPRLFASSSLPPSSTVVAPCNAQLNTTVTFPVSFAELMVLQPGSYLTSDTITVQDFDFCVKLYPKGGGHSYQLPFAQQKEEKVGVYLQFLPRDSTQRVDASFCLRLIGQQNHGPRFNVEWRSGMRFVPLSDTKLAQGRANDFGAHLMQTALLRTFLGITEETYFHNKEPIKVDVEIQLHGIPQIVNEDSFSRSLSFRDIRQLQDDQHDTEQVRVGRVIVPVLNKISQRRNMFAKGVYPGVEYRILRITSTSSSNDLFYSQPKAYYALKPIYSLVPQLERQWPVSIRESEIPEILTPFMYNSISAVGSLIAAATGLLLAFLLSQAISVFYIPSRSMEPTLQVGDVLLVEKVSSRLLKNFHTGDVVLFAPPEQLKDIVVQTGGRLSSRDLFVKRIAAEQGDSIKVDARSGTVQVNDHAPTGRRDLCQIDESLIRKYLVRDQSATTVPLGNVAVLGDCGAVSIDSRVWGPLPKENIVGRPLVRIWPLSKFGPVPPLPLTRD